MADALTLLAGKRVYLLGPMTGYEDHNRPAFREATRMLRSAGVRVISPDELDMADPIPTEEWADYLARDIRWVAQAEAGVAMPGWDKSQGAILESCILNTLKKPVYRLNTRDRTLALLPESKLPKPVLYI